MNASEIKPLPPPPGVIGAIKAGLDVISGHLGILLLPLTLDIFLWFGPRLSLKNLFLSTFDWMVAFNEGRGFTAEEIAAARDSYLQFFQGFNLLGVLRTFPVGVSSLMQSKMPVGNPLGAPTVFEVDSALASLGSFLLLVALGWILGGYYFNRVSALVAEPVKPLRSIAQTLLFSVGFSIFAVAVGMPVLAVLAVLGMIDAFVMQVGFFAIAMLASWLVVPVFFAPHGIFLRGQDALHSLLSSLRMARFTLPSASMFVLAIFVVSQGLNLLWSVPSDDSWMLLVGMAGHAFITTSLLAASFIYYRDMNAWLEIALERLKTGTAAPQV